MNTPAFDTILNEVIAQMALGTANRKMALDICRDFLLLAKHTENQNDITGLFWLLIGLEESGKLALFKQYWTEVAIEFSHNPNVPTALQKYVLPLKSNRPIPDAIRRNYPINNDEDNEDNEDE